MKFNENIVEQSILKSALFFLLHPSFCWSSNSYFEGQIHLSSKEKKSGIKKFLKWEILKKKSCAIY